MCFGEITGIVTEACKKQSEFYLNKDKSIKVDFTECRNMKSVYVVVSDNIEIHKGQVINFLLKFPTVKMC